MRDLMIDYVISLDGFAAADGWPGLWGMGGPDYVAWLGGHGPRTTLMGATTYRLMSGMAEEEPEAFAAMEGMDKVVFSSTLTEPLAWANTRLVSDDPVRAVRTMKDGDGPRLSTLGSLTLARSLLTAGLVDRFRVVVFPVVNGSTGRERIFDGYPDVRLELVESRTFDDGLQLLDYVPTVLDHPPLS